MTGIILAAGRGARMGCLTLYRPKPLLEVDGTPLLYRTLRLLTKIGIGKIVCVVGYRHQMVISYLEALRASEAWLSNTDISITVSDAWKNKSRQPFDYLDSLLTAKEQVGLSDFCVIHSDEVFSNVKRISRAREEFSRRRPLMLLLVKSIEERHFIRVRLEPIAEDVGRIIEYLPGYPQVQLPGQLGITFCGSRYWNYIEEARSSRKFAPDLALRDKMSMLAFHYSGEWWQFNAARDIARYRRRVHTTIAG